MNTISNLNQNKAIVLACAIAFSFTISSQMALAHGTVTSPLSRIAQCASEGVENMTSAACRAAVALSGTSGFYDINSVNQGAAAGDHLAVVPDGLLCSGGQAGRYAGLDLARADWVAAAVDAGDVEFTWTLSAPHATEYYRYFITPEGYDFSEPLTWSDLEFLSDTGPSPQEDSVTHTVYLPQRTGKHIVYSVWQRGVEDSPEAFYACVDVDFDGNGNSSSGSGSSSSSGGQFDTCKGLHE